MDNQPKITGFEIYLLFCLGGFVDLADFIPVLGTIFSIAFAIFFFIYLYLKGLPQTGPLIINLIELVPVLDIIPGTIFAVGLAVFMDRTPAAKKAAMKMQLRKKLSGKLNRLKSAEAGSPGGLRGLINRRRIRNLENQVAALDKAEEPPAQRRGLSPGHKPASSPPPRLPVDEPEPNEKNNQFGANDSDNQEELTKRAA